MRSNPLPSVRRGRRLGVLAGAALTVAGCVALTLPANAAVTTHSPVQPEQLQTIRIPAGVGTPAVARDTFDYQAPDVPALLHQAAPALDQATTSSTAAALGDAPGERLPVVGAALSYLGTRYVLDGAGHSGIDCSGLVMAAYATIGRGLAHSVSAQDRAGAPIGADQARPGDLVVFNDDEHIGMYLGAGLLVAAPAPGRRVEVQQLSSWSGIPHHFVSLLGA